MSITIRLALLSDYQALEKFVIDSFEPITWQKKQDEAIGPLNNCDWRERWRQRMQRIFATQQVFVGEADGHLAAMASATIDRELTLAFIDVLAVGIEFQGRGLGREMLRGTIAELKQLGCKYVQLDCLTDNETGNALYASEGFCEVARHIRWFKAI